MAHSLKAGAPDFQFSLLVSPRVELNMSAGLFI
jgi:hypothetical protein